MKNKQDLKKALKEVAKLEQDLHAEIYHEAIGHFEEVWDGYSSVSSPPPDRWVEDYPERTEPDIETREFARTRLQQIYESSEWYSARYKASYALKKYRLNLDTGISNLEVLLKSQDNEKRRNARRDLKYLYKNFSNQEKRERIGILLGYSPLRIWVNESKIWADEHPIVATAGGIAAIGAATGIGYIIYQYLAK